jgi:hypothetical protein
VWVVSILNQVGTGSDDSMGAATLG